MRPRSIDLPLSELPAADSLAIEVDGDGYPTISVRLPHNDRAGVQSWAEHFGADVLFTEPDDCGSGRATTCTLSTLTDGGFQVKAYCWLELAAVALADQNPAGAPRAIPSSSAGT